MRYLHLYNFVAKFSTIMPQTKYNLHLKGYVGGYDFDRDYVDYVLARNEGKSVHAPQSAHHRESSTLLRLCDG